MIIFLSRRGSKLSKIGVALSLTRPPPCLTYPEDVRNPADFSKTPVTKLQGGVAEFVANTVEQQHSSPGGQEELRRPRQ